jgi:hypothetical protein
MRVRLSSVLVTVLLVTTVASMWPVAGQDRTPLHAPLDELLDLYVRDGLVYYRALDSDRRKLDAYIASLDGPQARSVESWPREEQIAFWLNAYNAWVLRAVVDHYPIRGTSGRFPEDSLRQVPGVFDKTARRVAGRALTLDQIETTVLGPFRDPRLYLALGRGAVGSGRLRSEAFTGTSLGGQLESVAREFATSGRMLDIDEARGVVGVTPILSWREKDFVAAYAGAVPPRYAQRSDVEKALLAFVDRNLLQHERDFLERNDFKVEFKPFDWSLNDLSGGGRR